MLEEEEQSTLELLTEKKHKPAPTPPRLEGDLSNRCIHSSSKSHPDPLSL